MKNTKHKMSESKSLMDAIQEGKSDYSRYGGYEEETWIKFAVCRFLWNEFQGKMDGESFQVMQKITE